MKTTFAFLCLFACSIAARCNPLGGYTNTDGISEEIRSNLYVRQAVGSPVLLDGNLIQYGPAYSNNVDGMDARKMNNFSENFGMTRGTTVLVIERREVITTTDTIFYKMWKMHQRPYQLEFVTSNLNHPDLEAYLEDSYLETSVPVGLNGRTTADFDVTADPASASPSRFRIVFKSAEAAALPVTFDYINAYPRGSEIRIDWKTENEGNTKGYSIERSADGMHFLHASEVSATNLAVNNYSWADVFPSVGDNYYRIGNTDLRGKVSYSEVLKVFRAKSNAQINIYPNPVVNNTIQLRVANQAPGTYEIRLINSFGQPLFSEKIQHNGGDITRSIRPGQQVERGIYQLEIISPGKTKLSGKVAY